MSKLLVLLAAVTVSLAACGSSTTDEPAVSGAARQSTTTSADADETTTTTAAPSADQEFPDVVEARATRDPNGTFTFDVTISSPYDTPERYADAWRVLGSDGTEYGIRVLTHDHASEQPFTRSQSGIEIPESVDTVTIEGRDQANGWGGTTVDVAIPPLDYC